MNGKGSSPRNCFSDDYRRNFDSIFRASGCLRSPRKPSLAYNVQMGTEMPVQNNRAPVGCRDSGEAIFNNECRKKVA